MLSRNLATLPMESGCSTTELTARFLKRTDSSVCFPGTRRPSRWNRDALPL